MTCFDKNQFVEGGVNRVLTQYRESKKLLFMIRTYLTKLHEASEAICDLPVHFNLDTSVGDQLTIIGKWMGFPRCHFVCDVQPVFGFECKDEAVTDRPIVGFCEEGSWQGCFSDGVSEICINDDDLYRAILIARSYQMQGMYDWDSLQISLRAIFGDQAKIMDSGHRQVVLAPLRELSQLELATIKIIGRALPIAPGISQRWHFGTFEIFGFGEGWGGFCEEWIPEGLPITTDTGAILVDENGAEIWTGPLTKDADWLCREDIKPYDC